MKLSMAFEGNENIHMLKVLNFRLPSIKYHYSYLDASLMVKLHKD